MILVKIFESVRLIQSTKTNYHAYLSVYLLIFKVSQRWCIHNTILFLNIGGFCFLLTGQIGANSSVSPVHYWIIVQGENC